MAGRYYDEFQVGMKISHDIHRTVTETDNLLITTLTHNPAALHLDATSSESDGVSAAFGMLKPESAHHPRSLLDPS